MTHQEQACLETIKRLTRGNVTPSLDAIASGMGLRSKSGAHRLVHSLIEQGYLALDTGRRRNSIIVLSPLQAEINRLVAMHGIDAVRQAVIG